jgi:hypothetical protein
MVTSENTVETGEFEFTANASDLGISPGSYPEMLSTTLGNKIHFRLAEHNEEFAIYEQLLGCISLKLFNDSR